MRWKCSVIAPLLRIQFVGVNLCICWRLEPDDSAVWITRQVLLDAALPPDYQGGMWAARLYLPHHSSSSTTRRTRLPCSAYSAGKSSSVGAQIPSASRVSMMATGADSIRCRSLAISAACFSIRRDCSSTSACSAHISQLRLSWPCSHSLQVISIPTASRRRRPRVTYLLSPHPHQNYPSMGNKTFQDSNRWMFHHFRPSCPALTN